MAKTPKPEPLYRYVGAKAKRHRRGVKRGDLFAADVARMPPALLKDITGGPNPMYEAVAGTGGGDGDHGSDPANNAPNLREMKRPDLNAYATEHGVSNPDDYPNKDELIAAVEQAGTKE